jgi:hypothetical protein
MDIGEHASSPLVSKYVDPTVITKQESPDDSLYIYSPVDLPDHQQSDSSSGSWASDSNRTSAVFDADGFDVAHSTFTDEGYNFSVYDPLEFQTLKESMMSDQYLRL